MAKREPQVQEGVHGLPVEVHVLDHVLLGDLQRHHLRRHAGPEVVEDAAAEEAGSRTVAGTVLMNRRPGAPKAAQFLKICRRQARSSSSPSSWRGRPRTAPPPTRARCRAGRARGPRSPSASREVHLHDRLEGGPHLPVVDDLDQGLALVALAQPPPQLGARPRSRRAGAAPGGPGSPPGCAAGTRSRRPPRSSRAGTGRIRRATRGPICCSTRSASRRRSAVLNGSEGRGAGRGTPRSGRRVARRA